MLTLPNDSEIAAAATNAIKQLTHIPPTTVQISVRDGSLTLEGKVDWWFRREAAQHAVEHLAGVRAVTNLIMVVEPSESPQTAAIRCN